MAEVPAVPKRVKEFAKEIYLSVQPGAPPLNLESLKSRIQVGGWSEEELQLLLFTAIETAQLDFVKFLIEEQHVSPNRLHTRHFAMVGSEVVVRSDMVPSTVLQVILTTQQRDIPKERLNAMFMYLVEKVYPEILRRSIKTGDPLTNNATILHYLSAQGVFEKFGDTLSIVRRICERDPQMINMQSGAGDTPLHVAASGNPVMVRELLRLGASMRLQNMNGKYPRDITALTEPIGREIRAIFDNVLEPGPVPPGSPPRGPAAAGAPGPGSPDSPPHIGSPSDPQAGGRRRTRRKRSKRKSRRHYRVKY